MNLNKFRNKLIIAAMLTFALGATPSEAVQAEPVYDLSNESNRRAVNSSLASDDTLAPGGRGGSLTGFAATVYTDLQEGVSAEDIEREVRLESNYNVIQDLGSMGGENSTLTIDGQGYDINGNSKKGLTVNIGQTLNIQNVGSFTRDTETGAVTILNNGANGFYKTNWSGEASYGAVVYNYGGTINIENSLFMNNDATYGGVINGTVNSITNSVFKNNRATNANGGVVNGLVKSITNSSFLVNRSCAGIVSLILSRYLFCAAVFSLICFVNFFSSSLD